METRGQFYAGLREKQQCRQSGNFCDCPEEEDGKMQRKREQKPCHLS